MGANKNYFNACRNSVFFTNIPDSEIRKLLATNKNVEKCQKGEVIIKAGINEEKFLGLILKGTVSVTDAESDTIIDDFSISKTFGTTLVMSPSKRSNFEVKAKTSLVFLKLRDYELEEMAANNNRYFANLMLESNEKVKDLLKVLRRYAGVNTFNKLAIFLKENLETEKNEDGSISYFAPLKVPMNKLAKSLSIGRASLYRSLTYFEEQGIAKKDGKRFIIIDIEKLNELV